MADLPRVEVYPHGRDEDGFPAGPPVVTFRDHGLEIALFFDSLTENATLVELRLKPEEGDALEPRALRRFAPQTDLYVAAARAAMTLNRDDLLSQIAALRKLGGPGRGLDDDFYRNVATAYKALIEGGEPHPIKALGESCHVTISAASRWVKEARRRGFIKEPRS